MGVNDLTTLAAVQRYMNPNSSATSPNTIGLSEEITRVSRTLISYLSRDSILSRSYSEVRNGKGSTAIMLKKWPVTSITQLVVNNQLILPGSVNTPGPQASVNSPGYYYDQWDGLPPGEMVELSLVRSWFYKGVANITVNYVAGYLTTGESQVIGASPFQLTPLAPYGMMAADAGVTYANGTALVAVAASPAVGQYVAPSPFSANAVPYYQFAAADSGQTVLLSYSYVPSDLEGVACQMVAERTLYKSRIGQKSKTLGGQETIAYDTADIPAWAKLALQNYKSVVPIY